MEHDAEVSRLTARGETVLIFVMAAIITALLIGAAWIGQELKVKRVCVESLDDCYSCDWTGDNGKCVKEEGS